MTLATYERAAMLEVLRTTKRIPMFWLDKYFTSQINFQDDYIAFDKVSTEYRRMAPFVAPNVQGRVLRKEGYSTVSYKPAYVKPKDVLNPNTDLVRRAGEPLVNGGLSLQQRRDACVKDLLEKQSTFIDNRLEWMAARGIIDGSVTVEGIDYPKVTIDFQRDASLTSTLAGAAKWDTGTAAPLTDIKTKRAASNTLCGAVIKDVYFGANAWALFTGFTAVQDLLKMDVRGSTTDLTKVLDGFDGIEYGGFIGGSGGANYRCWIYTGKYMSDADVLTDILDTNTVVGVSEQVGGVRCFGAIMDPKAGYTPVDKFPSNWVDNDPPVEYVMMQSAPLMIPKQPNATFKIKVA